MCLGCMDIPLKWLSYISRECKRQLLITVKYRMVEKTMTIFNINFNEWKRKINDTFPQKVIHFFLFKEEFAIIKFHRSYFIVIKPLFVFSGGYNYLHVAKPGLDIPQATQKEQPDYVIISFSFFLFYI